MACGDDPSMTDTWTLKRSLNRDIVEAYEAHLILDKQRWLEAALVTTHELLRRDQAALTQPEAPDHG